MAQTENTVEWWRTVADSLVTAGNRAYLQSDRLALHASVRGLEGWLRKGLDRGICTQADSLVYTADWFKLRADERYECAADTAEAVTEAIGWFAEALHIYKAYPELNRAHASTVIHEELAQLHFRIGHYDRALEEMNLVMDDFEQRIALGEIEKDDPLGPQPYDDYLVQLSAQAMCQARCGRYAEAEAALDKVLREYSDQQCATYAELLRRQAKVLMLRYEQTPSSALRKRALTLYHRCFALQLQFAYTGLLQHTSAQRESCWQHLRPLVADAYRTEEADASFLYDVTLSLKSLLLQVARWENLGMDVSQMKSALEVKWTDVQRKLQRDEAAVEFITYEQRGQQRMAALVLHAQGRPVWVPMPSPLEITGYEFPTFHDTVEQRISSTSRRRKDGLYTDSTLCTLVWPEALRCELKGSKRVFFSPDAFQHRLAMEYMWPDKSNDMEFYRLTSTRRLLERMVGCMTVDSALICGAVDYDAQCAESQPTADNDTVAYGMYHDGRVQFPLLEHSGAEVDGVTRTRHCSADILLRGAEADEVTFRSLSGRYPMVFLSTHGDFNAAAVPQGTDLKPCLTDHSLSENVVALAGVNPSLLAGSFDAEAHADGLLSALEMSRLDLRRVNLFVISACQTALGFITSDGVYGIQRGLKQAGVGAMLLSLWSVHDEATSQLMQEFHRGLSAGLGAHDALQRSRAAMCGKQIDAPFGGNANPAVHTRFDASTLSQQVVTDEADVLYDTPQYTDAFILIDALPQENVKRKQKK